MANVLKHQLFSRCSNAPERVDFRPEMDAKSPSAQLRRLASYLDQNIIPVDDITDCPDAVNYLREYVYRKIFTGTTHEEYVELDKTSPDAIDWLIAVHEVESAAHARHK